jgi:drug/metabolite transporter (DMT)-like permease
MSSISLPENSKTENRTLLGVTFLFVATLIYPLQDVVIKTFSNDYAVHQIVFLRSLFSLPIIFLIAYYDGALRDFRVGSWPLQLLRAFVTFCSYLFYYMALATIGLAETAAITFAAPLFVTVMAFFFLGEKVGIARWGSVIVGLIGVIIVVQPGSNVFDPAAILAVLAAFTYGSSTIITRKLGAATNGGTTAIITVLFFIFGGAVLGLIFSPLAGQASHPSVAFLYRAWIWPAPEHWWLFAAIGVISGIGFFCLIQAYRVAEASVVTPFEYVYLFWSVLWGWVFFSALPGPSTWLGLALIVGAGLFIVYRETVKGRRIVRRRGLGVMRQR